MLQLKIFYSLQKSEDGLPRLKLFSDEKCARLDQEYFNYWDGKKCYGHFVIDVTGSMYIADVVTESEWKSELEKFGTLYNDLLSKLQ